MPANIFEPTANGYAGRVRLFGIDEAIALVAIEPGGTPQVGSEQYNRLLEAKIPIAIYFGDYIDNGPEDIAST